MGEESVQYHGPLSSTTNRYEALYDETTTIEEPGKKKEKKEKKEKQQKKEKKHKHKHKKQRQSRSPSPTRLFIGWKLSNPDMKGMESGHVGKRKKRGVGIGSGQEGDYT